MLKNKIKEENITDRQFAHELYCSLCNQVWIDDSYNENEFKDWFDRKGYTERMEEFPNNLCFSWRSAGGLISESCYKFEDDYLEFYCCSNDGNVGEGSITKRVEEFWNKLGFKLVENIYFLNNK